MAEIYGYIYDIGDVPFSEYPKAKVVAFIDESEPYEVDQTAILRNGRNYLLAVASGCSCWSGEWGIEEFKTRKDLIKSLKTQDHRDYNPSFRGIETLLAQIKAL